MSDRAAFRPNYGKGQNLSATTSSQIASFAKGYKSMRFVNTGAVGVFVRIFSSRDGALTASSADVLVQQNSPPMVLGMSEDNDSLAYLAASATTTLNIITGEDGQ